MPNRAKRRKQRTRVVRKADETGIPMRTTGDEMFRLATEVNHASAKAETRLKLFFDGSQLASNKQVYTIKHRSKSVYDVVAKVNRKRAGQAVGSKYWHYEPNHITDGCGYRIVTVFQSEIVDVVRELIRMIKHESGETPFIKGRLKEAVIYTNRPVLDDSLAMIIKTMIDGAGFVFDDARYKTETAAPANKKSGYSSVHLVPYVDVDIEDFKGKKKRINLSVEIQIRDIFEEAWGEVDHALRYVITRNTAQAEDADNTLMRAWGPHLNALKTFADGCSQHASLIKRNAIDAASVTSAVDHLSIDETKDIIENLIDRLPGHFEGEIREAYAIRDRALELVDDPSADALLDRAASAFRNILKLAKRYRRRELGNARTIGYRFEMELAHCLRRNDPTRLAEAISIYRRILGSFPNDVTAHYRLAMAMRAAGQFDECIEEFNRAAQSIDLDPSIGGNHWVASAIPRNMGYAYWCMAERDLSRDDTTGALANFETAIIRTKTAVDRAERTRDSEQQKEKSLNNVVYFLARCVELEPRGNPGVYSKSLLSEQIKALEKMITGDGKPTSISSLHTLAYAYQIMGNEIKSGECYGKTAKALLELARRNAGKTSLSIHDIPKFLPSGMHDIVSEVVSRLNVDLSGPKGLVN